MNYDSCGTDRLFRVGVGTASYDAETGIKLSVLPYGRGGVYTGHASGDLRLPMDEIRKTIRTLYFKLTDQIGDTRRGVPGAVAAVGDALTALRLAIQDRKGTETRADWWRKHYHALAAQEHNRCFGAGKLPANLAASTAPKAETGGKANAPVPVVTIQELRALRHEAERKRAAAEVARQRELAKARMSPALTVEASGQVAMKV